MHIISNLGIMSISPVKGNLLLLILIDLILVIFADTILLTKKALK